jgi:hypothetical protein
MVPYYWIPIAWFEFIILIHIWFERGGAELWREAADAVMQPDCHGVPEPWFNAGVMPYDLVDCI